MHTHNGIKTVLLLGALSAIFLVAGSAIALVLLAPLLAMIALVIKLDSEGTVFYRQLRIGLEGERLEGRVLGGGGEWFLVGPDGFGRIDVRIQFETVDGAHIYVQYVGLLELNEAVQAFITGQREETEFGDQYFRIAPRLETGDPRYAWVNQTLFVAEGRGYPGYGVEYRVYRVT